MLLTHYTIILDIHLKEILKINLLAKYCTFHSGRIHHLWLKFQFNFKKGSPKNFFERRDYESVDDNSISWVCPKKRKKKNPRNNELNTLITLLNIIPMH